MPTAATESGKEIRPHLEGIATNSLDIQRIHRKKEIRPHLEGIATDDL